MLLFSSSMSIVTIVISIMLVTTIASFAYLYRKRRQDDLA